MLLLFHCLSSSYFCCLNSCFVCIGKNNKSCIFLLLQWRNFLMFAKMNFVYICLKIVPNKKQDQMSPLSRFFYFSIFLNFDTIYNQTNANLVKSDQRRHQLKFHKVHNHLKQFQRNSSSKTFNSNFIVSFTNLN